MAYRLDKMSESRSAVMFFNSKGNLDGLGVHGREIIK